MRSGSSIRSRCSTKRSHVVCDTSAESAWLKRCRRATLHTIAAKRSTIAFQASESPPRTRSTKKVSDGPSPRPRRARVAPLPPACTATWAHPQRPMFCCAVTSPHRTQIALTAFARSCHFPTPRHNPESAVFSHSAYANAVNHLLQLRKHEIRTLVTVWKTRTARPCRRKTRCLPNDVHLHSSWR